MDRPLVSVLMPCYNHGEYVGEAIESVLRQTYPNVELIVADNGSTDDSYQVISKYGSEIKKIIRMENNNLDRCYSLMREEASGEYIAMMTSDDFWEADKLELQMRVFEENPDVKACTTQYVTVDENMKPIEWHDAVSGAVREEVLKGLLSEENVLAWPSLVLEREMYYKMHTKGYRIIYDIAVFLQVLMQGSIYVIPGYLLRCRWHPNGANRNESNAGRNRINMTDNEWSDLVCYAFDNMSDELFRSLYREEMIDSTAVDEKKIACEKFFVMQRLATENIDYFGSVLRYFYTHYQYCGDIAGTFADVLEKEYGYRAIDFSKWSGLTCLSRVGKDLSAYQSKAERELKYKDRQVCALKKSLMARVRADEMGSVRGELFASLPPTSKKMMRELEECIVKFLSNAEDDELLGGGICGYESAIAVLNELEEKMNQSWDDLMFLELDLKKGDWEMCRELIRLANSRKVNLGEAILPFWERVGEMLQSLWKL